MQVSPIRGDKYTATIKLYWLQANFNFACSVTRIFQRYTIRILLGQVIPLVFVFCAFAMGGYLNCEKILKKKKVLRRSPHYLTGINCAIAAVKRHILYYKSDV